MEPLLRVLGPLEVSGEGVEIPPGRHQVVLGALVLDANRVVRVDQLIDALWYDDPPATARTQVQICVSGLRQALTPLGDRVAIITRAPGYVLRVSRELVDLLVFQDLAAESEMLSRDGRGAEAAQRLREALALWHGPTLSGTPSRVLQARAAQLDERRLGTIEAYAELELRLGRHHGLAEELMPLVDEHPLRERMRGQLMLALYRDGRQADALRAYRDGRAILVDQLGLEPGDDLRALERAILAGDPGLRGEAPAAPVTLAAVTEPHPPVKVVPAMLPTDLSNFTGREALIEALESALDAAKPVAMLMGKPGVGKTSLALHVAQRLCLSYPDGQLYADLGGTRPEPASPIDVLGRFLRALGLPGEAIPEGLDDLVLVYRRLLDGRRVLIVLDDAESDPQIGPLIPRAGPCGVIVTSRVRLLSQPQATVVEVDVMDSEQSVRLLGSVIGDARVAAERAAAEALTRLVGGLPLALRVVAARLAARPHWSLAWMRDRLADERRRLDELAHGSLMVRASLALSYDGLEHDARQLFRFLAGLDSVTFPVWVGATLLDSDVFRASDLLEVLVDVQLLEISAVDLNGSPRYKFHEIIRLFAREQLERDESADLRHDNLIRVGGGWLSLAQQAHRHIYGGDYTVVLGQSPLFPPPSEYADNVLEDPMRWLEAERVNLCAVVAQAARAGADELAWSLAVAMVALFETRCYYEDWERTHVLALEAVRRAGNARGEAALLCSLASLHLSRSRLDEVEPVALPSLAAFRELGDRTGAALASRNLGMLHHMRREAERAMASYREALDDFVTIGDPIGQAHVLSQMAQLRLRNQEFEVAGENLARALALCRGIGNRRVESQVRYRLSGLMLAEDRLEDAEDLLIDLLELVKETGDLVGHGRVLHRLGVINARQGRADEARELLREALSYGQRVLDRKGVAEIRTELARLAA